MANPQHIAWLQEGVEAWNARRRDKAFTPDFSGEKIGETFIRAGKFAIVEGVPIVPLAGADLSDADFRGAELGGELVPPYGTGFLKADFSGATLAHADFTSAKFREASFAGAYIESAIFTDANLYKSNFAYARCRAPNFERAHLRGSDFSHASLRGPIFTDARLQESNFSHAYLSGANFTNADLSGVDFSDAAIRYADLEAAKVESDRLSKARDLSHSHPVSARLFPAGQSRSPIDFELPKIGRVGDFIEWIQTMKTAYEQRLAEVVMYFRGEDQDYTQTSLMPSGMRDGLIEYQNEMLRDLIARCPADFSQAKSALDLWMLAQHHGLPTQFLDITRDPLVGLFFACGGTQENAKHDGYVHIFATPKRLVKPFDSDSVSVITNFARLSYHDKVALLGDERAPNVLGRDETPYPEVMRRLYQLIQQEKPYFEKRIDIADFYRVLVVEPQQSTERIRAQRGAFLISAYHWRFTPGEIHKWNPGIPVYAHHRLRVPHNRKEALREQLAMLNVTRETLFPGLESAAEAVRDSYKPKA